MSRIAETLLPSPYIDGLPGRKEETTSLDAARAVSSTAATLRSQVLEAIALQPRTADEVAESLGQTVLAVRPRCSELRTTGKIVPLLDERGRQVRRKNASGINAIVWRTASEQPERTNDAEA